MTEMVPEVGFGIYVRETEIHIVGLDVGRKGMEG